MKIILGSASKWRQDILREMGYEFQVVATDIDEKSIRTEDYHNLPLLVARAKAEALKPLIKEPAILLTADVIAVFEGKILEKPADAEEARQTLRSYANKVAEAITGVVAINTKSGKIAEGLDVSKVHFKAIPEDVIEQLIQKGNILNCAGSFEIKDPMLRQYVDHIDGTVESIAGFPIELVKKLIKKAEKEEFYEELHKGIEKIR